MAGVGAPSSDGPLGPVVEVVALLAPERAALLDLLGALDDAAWQAPTACPGWSVHDLALHVVHDDLRRLSGARDGHAGTWLEAASLDALAAGLDEVNEAWVRVARSAISPRLTRALLAWLAEPTRAWLAGLDPGADGVGVTWAGPGPHPNWLDVAREYTERWVHQQQIRLAVDRPGLEERAFVEPVVDTFTRALLPALPARPPGTEVELRVRVPFERRWTVRASPAGWGLAEPTGQPAAVVEAPAAVIWQRAVRMLSHEQAAARATVTGDAELAAAVLDLRAAIVGDGPRG